MAAGYLQHFAGDWVEVRSAGSAPADSINPAVVIAMKEEGINLSAKRPKILSDEDLEASDVVITMGCGDVCPIYPGTRYLDWKLDDPAGQGIDAIRPIRDQIKSLVKELISTL
jgi:arsenate reductase